MAVTSLVFSAEKTSFDPQAKGCLIIGQPRHLQSVSFDDFAEKLSPRVDASVRKRLIYLIRFHLYFIFDFILLSAQNKSGIFSISVIV